MDPDTGKLYSTEEAKNLPKDIQNRLVGFKPAPTDPKGSRRVRRGKDRGVKIPGTPPDEINRRRAANKKAKQARKKNRK